MTHPVSAHNTVELRGPRIPRDLHALEACRRYTSVGPGSASLPCLQHEIDIQEGAGNALTWRAWHA